MFFIPSAPLALTLGGLIPFVGLAAISILAPGLGGLDARFALAIYGATIVSFLGGARWGLALSTARFEIKAGVFAGATVPPLVAWVAAFTPGLARGPGLWLLILALIGMWVWDVRPKWGAEAPDWYPALRSIATAGATASLAAAALWGG